MSEPADKTAATTVGERLRAARSGQGLTLQKIAEDLHLDLSVLEAMEGDRFRALGAPVYARGHLRKYAQTLGLNVDALLTDYEAAHTGPVAPTLVPTLVEHPVMVPERGKPRFGIAAVITAVLLVSAIGGGFWWWQERPRDAQASAAPDASAAPVESKQSASTQTVPAARDVPAAKALTAALPPVSGTQMSAGSVAHLRMRFSADSWVEVYDTTGKRLMFDQGLAGGVRAVVGAPPLRVLLGNFTGVELTLDGRRVAVPEGSHSGATARFRVMPGGTTLAFWGS